MAQTPNRALTIAYNADGHPWKERQLNQALDRLLTTLAKAGNVRSATDDKGDVYCPLTIHGLRHARGVEIAYAGGSDAEIMAQLEHSTDRQAKVYRRQADRRRLADAGQQRVDNVVKLKRLAAEQRAKKR
jgi:integrase